MKLNLFNPCQAASLALLFGLASFAVGTATAKNLVKNPSFEEPLGPNNWTVVYDNCDPDDFLVAGRTTMANKDAVPGTWDADPPGSTNYLSKAGGHFAPNYCNGLMHGYFRQVLTNLRPGIQYTCSAWMVQYTRNDNYLARSQVWMEVLGGPNLTVSKQTPYVTENASNNPGGWKPYALTHTASQNGELEIRLHYAFVRTIAQIWEYRNINAFYDDVEVQSVNQPPVPLIEVSPLAHFAGYTNLIVIASDNCRHKAKCDDDQDTDGDNDGCGKKHGGKDKDCRDDQSTNWHATVVLDGSKSYDPDDTNFYYFWSEGTNLLSTNAIAYVVLGVGTHQITLLLDDTHPMGTNSARVAVEVITPAQAVAIIMEMVENSALPRNRHRPLMASLEAAASSFERGQCNAAVNQLGAFQNKLRAQVERDNPVLAEQLSQAAQEIIAVVDDGQTRPNRQFTRVERMDHGQVRMELAAEPVALRVIEVSTNLVDWRVVGVPSKRSDGTFEFTAPDAAGAPARFYRVRSLGPNGTP